MAEPQAIGLTCAYPGAGDGTPNGCFATAMMWCRGDGGVGDLDSGADAGPAARGPSRSECGLIDR